jgi:hypothetical protein
MPTRSSLRTIVDEQGSTYPVYREVITYENSPRVNGKLVLRANVLTHQRMSVMSHWRQGPPGPSWAPPGADVFSVPGLNFTSLDNQCYAKFQGKLRKGSASVGVTLASWKQSRDMIISRANSTRRTLDSSIARLSGNKEARKRLMREREPLAGQVLETEFGWRPLVQDINAALFTVCKDGIPPEWITSRARTPIWYSRSQSGSPSQRESIDGVAKVTYSAKADISNPNLWLLNRMGLINPGTVAWDLIPWSFVVNWFVNVNAMVSSITDEVGLTISNQSVTRSLFVGREVLSWTPNGSIGSSFSRVSMKTKSRSAASSLQPKWEVKVPDLNWELAVIATSLVVQRIQKLNRLIRLL